MTADDEAHVPGHITSVEQLRACYASPSSVVERKVRTRLDRHCRAIIAQSSLVMMATADSSGGCDVSPRGDAAGFVRVVDDSTLLIPDRKGNNRLDALTNLLSVDHIGLLFIVPGHHDTLRVNGRAAISDDPRLLAGFAVQGREPATVLQVSVDEVFMHCGRALMRGAVWDPPPDRVSLPSLGKILADHVRASDDERLSLTAEEAADLY